MAPHAMTGLLTESPPNTAPQAERRLTEAAERALRMPRGKFALALHLSRLKPPSPRAYHTRIARALLQDTAQRCFGQVFALRNGDLVLLCTLPAEAAPPDPLSPFALPASLRSLFGADVPDADTLTSIWRLETEAPAFGDYVRDRNADQANAPQNEEALGQTAALLPLEALIAAANVPDLLTQQTAIHLRPGRHLPLTARLAPLFRELTFPVETLLADAAVSRALADPYLFRHVANRLDTRMLQHLLVDLRDGGKITRGTLRQNLPLHLNLTLETIVSAEFARLADRAGRSNARFGVEVTLMEAASDPAMMAYASRVLGMAGISLTIDGVDHVSVALTRPETLAPAFVKLIWSPRLADENALAKHAIEAAIARIGPDRVVLQRADSEAALAWGQKHGILRYQGFFLDAIQAAARISGCHSARACTLRQCLTRAGSLRDAVRVGCGNPGLLDMAPVAMNPIPARNITAARVVPAAEAHLVRAPEARSSHAVLRAG
jgi:EAL domain-containing protein (putative c-di-GMP-specific phosphodiesterase class I)